MTRHLGRLRLHRHLHLVVDGYEVRTCTSAWTGRIHAVAFRLPGGREWYRTTADLSTVIDNITALERFPGTRRVPSGA